MSIEIPGYTIIRPIGRGGMATVYLAEQEIFEREVALKVMSRSFAEDPSFGQRFFREAKIVSRLVHPNIVTVHDVGEHDGHYYLSMEYIDGGDLKLARKRLTFRQKINAVKDIAKALQYAATKGYVHRDIKPENIMFHISDGRAVLTDFGIARAAEAEMSVTQTGVAIGTPHYMSPEQAKGLAVDGRADIYSLGVVLYLMLTGDVPYDAESAVAIGIKHITDPIPLLPMALNELQPIIDKMMAKSPDQRYQNAASLINALDDLDMPVLEKLALDFDREQKAREQVSDVEKDTPTLVSSSSKSISASAEQKAIKAAALRARQTPSPKAKTPVPKTVQKANTKENNQDLEKVTPQAQNTEINEALPEEKERFTVIYENELGMDSGGSMIGSMLVGLLIVAALGGSIYFYLNPSDWRSLLAKSQAIYEQTRDQIEEVAVNDTVDDPGSEQDSISQVEEVTSRESLDSVENELTMPAEGDNESQLASGDIEGNELEQLTADENTISEDPLAEGLEQVPAEPSEEELHLQAVAEKRENISRLQEAFSKDSAFLPDLVAAYRALLEIEPEDTESLAGIQNLEQSERTKITEMITDKKFSSARKKLEQLQLLFQESDPTLLAGLKTRIEKEERLENLLDKGKRLFAAGSITSPEEENALSMYKTVLESDAKNSRALAGVRKVSDYYLQQAREAYASEDIETAEEKVKLALEVDWKNDSAEKLLEDIRNLQERVAKRDLLLLQAEKALNEGNYFEPVKANAYHYYAQVLEESASDARALKGIDMTLEGFSAWVWSLVGEERFDEAKSAFITPMNVLPREERLQNLSKAVNAVIEERMVANRPVISKLLVSGEQLSDTSGQQADSLSVGKAIYVVFDYKNVAVNSSIIEAKLLDGAGNIEVSKKSIDVASGDGMASFSFDSPVGSFPSGLYTLVLSINARQLDSLVFSVQ